MKFEWKPDSLPSSEVLTCGINVVGRINRTTDGLWCAVRLLPPVTYGKPMRKEAAKWEATEMAKLWISGLDL